MADYVAYDADADADADCYLACESCDRAYEPSQGPGRCVCGGALEWIDERT